MTYVLISAVAIGLGVAGAAQAGLEICNETGRSRSLAVGYQSGDTWVSSGWWNIDDGSCGTVVSGDLEQRYYYYRATAADVPFDGEDYWFCTSPQVFNIEGDENCAARGFDRSDFRQVDTGESATQYKLTLVDEPAPPAPEKKTDPLPSGDGRGTYVETFSDLLIFQGCTVDDGSEYCAFHGNGWKYYAYYGGPTPRHLLDRLYNQPVGAAFHVSGEIVSFGDISMEVMVDSVTIAPGGDPFANLRAAMQGEWVSTDDPAYKIEIHGSEMWEFHGGSFLSNLFLQIADGCDAAPQGRGPVLIETNPEDREPLCYGIATATTTRLELIYFGRGNMLRFRRP
ncbi:putative integral membrane protein [Thalassovita gelatinovora]|uniref:Putative integral membrane protein n=1 Tax=Thalassovita gelatinovora TaxID=53501 RepID=A0A0P1F8Q7_THAGE|nr:DUF1036 domain-containing protein [Thalassovita gelatinovora]QIZ80238.1 DUF1036 domain-containing protein [Thalassovita gelatinovora]CUH64109.1 putative integral membrane protein [Thalassovita gelatinovora]SEQ83466.1 Uncharacterized membrane protein [Thalassovita gelatinovora]